MGLQQIRADRKRKRAIGEISLNEERIIRKHRHPRFQGVGDALDYIFRNRFNAYACGGCLTTKQKMNTNGLDWCKGNVSELAQEIHDNVTALIQSHQGGWVTMGEWLAYKVSGLHFHKQLVTEAINLYETTSTDNG